MTPRRALSDRTELVMPRSDHVTFAAGDLAIYPVTRRLPAR